MDVSGLGFVCLQASKFLTTLKEIIYNRDIIKIIVKQIERSLLILHFIFYLLQVTGRHGLSLQNTGLVPLGTP